jgi:tetratricopeptide (TPR) repeat protein
MRWITSEDVNVEHLLDVFTSVDAKSNEVWDACARFVWHLHRHKRRLVVLGTKMKGLADDHPSKPQCLFRLSQLFYSVGNLMESRRLLAPTLKLWREQENDQNVAQTLKFLAYVNARSGHHAEGISQAEEASGIYERLNNTTGQAKSLQCLALLFVKDDQVDAAEETALRAIEVSGNQSRLYEHHHILGHIYETRGDMEAAISHHETSLGIASSLNSQGKQIGILDCLVGLLLKVERFDDAQVYLERLKSDAVNDPLHLGRAEVMQARIWFHHGRLEEAKYEVLRVISVHEKLRGSVYVLEGCKEVLQEIEEKMNPVTSD